MALVAYGSSGESDLSDAEEDSGGGGNQADVKAQIPEQKVTAAAAEKKTEAESGKDDENGFHISDDEDEGNSGNRMAVDDDGDEEEEEMGDAWVASGSSTLFSKLKAPSVPETTSAKSTKSSLIDQEEDLSTIPKAKTYSDSDVIRSSKEEEEDDGKDSTKKVSRWSTKAKKARKVGPVKIMAPSM